MNSLAQSIQRLGLTGTAAEIVTAFSATVQQSDSTQWTYQAIATDSRFGQSVADALSSAILANNGQAAVIQFVVKGIDLSLDQSQAGLSAIAQAVPQIAAQCNALKSLGIHFVPRWQVAGLDALPTEADVTAALTQISNQQAVAAFMNETLNPLLATEPTPAQIKAAVAAWSV